MLLFGVCFCLYIEIIFLINFIYGKFFCNLIRIHFFLHTVEGEYDWMKSILFKIYDTTMNTYVDDMIYGEENSR